MSIIALIATPIILGIIKDSKEESNKRSVEMYAKAIENSIAQYQLEKNKPLTGTFETLDGKEILQNGELIFKVEYDGPKISIKRIDIYEDGSIYLEDIENDKKDFPKTYGKKQWYQNGDIVYFDVAKGKGCTQKEYESSWDESARDYLNSKTGYNGYINKDSSNNETEKLDNQNSCLKFYSFLDNRNDKINLLLDHNTSANLTWTTPEITTNENGPIDVKKQLKIDTNEWNETIIPINYEYKGISSSYTIDYSEYKARLITAQEVSQITGADKELGWKEESSGHWYYFHKLTSDTEVGRGDVCKIDGCKYGWIYDRTSTNCTTYGCLNDSDFSTMGYWAATAHTSNAKIAWLVYHDGFLYNRLVYHDSHYGVRPVIEVLKSNL